MSGGPTDFKSVVDSMWERRFVSYKCFKCQEKVPVDGYSMHRYTNGDMDTPVCNTCRTFSAQGTGFLFDPRETWRTQSACKDDDGFVFFPDTAKEIREAAWRPLCDSCPVRLECADFGRESGSEGVWGGEYIQPNAARGSKGKLLSKNVPPRIGTHLINKGECTRGHPVLSRNDLYFSRKPGSTSRRNPEGWWAQCHRCYRDNQNANKNKRRSNESEEQRELRLKKQRERNKRLFDERKASRSKAPLSVEDHSS